MVAFITKIWENLRHGRNIELYLAVLLAVVVLILELLDLAPQSLVLSLMLTVLAMLAVGLLVQRSQNDRIAVSLKDLERLKPTATQFFVPPDMTDILRLMQSANTVYLWGGILRTDIPLFEDAIRQGVALGRSYRALLLKPGGNAIEMAAARWTSFDSNELGRTLSTNIARLNSLNQNSARGKVEVKVLDDMNPYTMYAFDPELETGCLIVRLNSFAGDNSARATFWIERVSDRMWFDRFIDDYKAVWKRAEKWPSQ
jgi:hypothetical protein